MPTAKSILDIIWKVKPQETWCQGGKQAQAQQLRMISVEAIGRELQTLGNTAGRHCHSLNRNKKVGEYQCRREKMAIRICNGCSKC